MGYYTDSETGLCALAFRTYDPATGRFLQRDPIGYAGGVNLYGYVGNGPTGSTDSLGLAPKKKYEDGYSAGYDAAIDAYWLSRMSADFYGEQREWGTIVYRQDGGYYYLPLARGKPNMGGTTTTVELPKPPAGTTGVGRCHSHPPFTGGAGEVFSAKDKENAEANDQFSFLATPSGRIVMYSVDGKTGKWGVTEEGRIDTSKPPQWYLDMKKQKGL